MGFSSPQCLFLKKVFLRHNQTVKNLLTDLKCEETGECVDVTQYFRTMIFIMCHLNYYILFLEEITPVSVPPALFP